MSRRRATTHDVLDYRDATDLLAGYRRGAFGVREYIDRCIHRITRLDGALNAIWRVTDEGLAHQIQVAERRYHDGSPRALEGVPVVVKDLIDTAGTVTTYGSGIYRGYVPARDAAVVACLRAAGAIVLGKAATDEFAWGITTANPHFGPTRNPWREDLVPGGSSGGCAVALAADYAPLALGTDTAGSVRIPAAFCSVVGFKPTHGSVSTAGVHPLAPSIDHVGPMARSVRDLRLLDALIRPGAAQSGFDGDRARTLRVGVVDTCDCLTPAPEIGAVLACAASVLEGLGHDCSPQKLPHFDLYESLGAIVGTEALYAHHVAGTWPSKATSYGPVVRLRLEVAENIPAGTYVRAQSGRTRIRECLLELFGRVDMLLLPVSGTMPMAIDQVGDYPVYESFRRNVLAFTALASLSGFPAVAIRGGFVAGLPVGVQLIAAPGGEERLLRLAERYEAATPELLRRVPDFCHSQRAVAATKLLVQGRSNGDAPAPHP